MQFLVNVFLVLSPIFVNIYCRKTIQDRAFQSRIIGGGDVKIEEVPFMVIVLSDFDTEKEAACGGAYISKLWVLTAAHCLDVNNYNRSVLPDVDSSKQERITLRMGQDDVDKEDFQTSKSTKLIMHTEYFRNETFTTHDIGLIQINNAFKITEKVKIAKLPETEIDYGGALVALVGWGASKSTDIPPDNVTIPDKLQMVKTPVWKKSECAKHNPSNSALCIGEEGKASCSGDSGSSLVYEKFTVIGVCSYGYGCNESFTVYESTYPHIDWIKQVAEVGSSENETEGSTEGSTQGKCHKISVESIILVYCTLTILCFHFPAA